MASIGRLLRPIFQVRQDRAASGSGDAAAAHRMDLVVATVTRGCQAVLLNSRVEAVIPKLEAVDPELRGFAYEGAGTGLAALDCILPWKDRTRAFLHGPGAAYPYAIQIGAGMALARLRRRPEPFLARLDHVLSWMAVDGYGFHEGFFRRRHHVEGQEVPRHLSAYGRRVFDHGLGRSIWFLSSGSADDVVVTIGRFPAGRRRDIWSGIGLACGYTGGVDRAMIEQLRRAAGEHAAQLAVGAAIAANVRHRAATPAPYAERACEVLCGLSSGAASAVVDDALRDLPASDVEPPYEIWRKRLASRFSSGPRVLDNRLVHDRHLSS